MKASKHSYDSEANAALVRTAMKTGINLKKAGEYMNLIFDIFEISGKGSYKKLLEMMQEEDNFSVLAKVITEHSNSEELFEFAKSFIGIQPSGAEYDTDCNAKHDMKDDAECNAKPVVNRNSGCNNKSIAKRGIDCDVKHDIEIEIEETHGNFIELDPEYFEDIDFTIAESKKDTYLHIIDCEIKTQTLSDMQPFQYIETAEAPFEELRDDFAIGDHLKVLNEIYDNNEADGNLLLICESINTGLIAMKYLSSLLPEAEYDEEEDEEDQIGFFNRIPVINASQIDNYMQQTINNSAFFKGGFGFQTIQPMNNLIPWWSRYQDIPIIVLIQKGSYLSAEFPDKLKMLGETYPNIYVLFEKEESNAAQDTNSTGVALFGSDLRMIAEDISFKLAYNTYEIKDSWIESEYMRKVFMDAASSRSYKIGEDVNIEEILKLLKKTRGDGWEGNSSVVQLIRKAISLKRKNLGVLNQEDFSFLGRSLIAIKNNSNVQKKQDEKLESAVERMNRCIFGLDHVKQTMLDAVNLIKLNREREKAGLKSSKVNNVFVFYGPPGVGKTEMAQHFSEIMLEYNLLPGRRFININGAQLKGAYVGHTAPKVQEIFSKNDIIFIDECYSLTASDFSMDTFSQEALAELCIQLEKHAKDKLIIFAGYGGKDVSEEHDKMKRFLEANPGIASRVTFHIDFPKYSADREMPHIFLTMVNNSDYVLEDGWEDIVIDFFRIREKSESYGNGREARKLFQHAMMAQSARLACMLRNIGAPATETGGVNGCDVDSHDITNHDASDCKIYDLKLITLDDLRKACEKILAGENKMKSKERVPIGFRGL